MGGALSNFGYLCTVHKHDLCTITCATTSCRTDVLFGKILEIPDAEYKDSMITSDMRRFIKQVDEEYTANMADFKSHIAPSYWEYKSN